MEDKRLSSTTPKSPALCVRENLCFYKNGMCICKYTSGILTFNNSGNTNLFLLFQLSISWTYVFLC